jgi:flagellar motor switch protein FliM
MSSKRSQFLYSKSLKLGPAIGDWTKIHVDTDIIDEVQVSEVKNVNFDSLPREDMHLLHLLHYRLAEKIAKKLSQDMNIKVELHTILATQLSYGEFAGSQDEKVVQANYMVKQFGDINVIFDWDLADVMVDRLTGGKGESTHTEEFSELEVSILEAQVESLIPIVSKSWETIFNPEDLSVNFSIGDYIVEKRNSLREAYVIFSFHMYYGRGELKKIIWAYPNRTIRKLLRQYRSLNRPLVPTIKLEDRTIDSINIPVQVLLGNATLTMQELQELQVGDVISLNRKCSDLLEITLGDNCKLFGQPGVHDHHLAMQVVNSEINPDSFESSSELDIDEGLEESYEHIGPKVVISKSKSAETNFEKPSMVESPSETDEDVETPIEMASVIPDDLDTSTPELSIDSTEQLEEEPIETIQSESDDPEPIVVDGMPDDDTVSDLNPVIEPVSDSIVEPELVSQSDEVVSPDLVGSEENVEIAPDVSPADDGLETLGSDVGDDLGDDLDFDEDFSWDDLDDSE